MRPNKSLATIGLVSSLAWLGCAESIPKELTDARAAYDRASHGPAQDLTPADVHVARTSLEDAERAFDAEGDSALTRDLAYVAMRRSEIAESKARTMAARRETERLAAQREANEDARQARTTAELEAARQQIQGTNAQLTQEQQRRMQEEQRRIEAEKRAQQAMQDLASVAAVKEESRGTVITLSGEVLFESGKAELRPVATAKLAQVADALTTNDPNSQIHVEGHTDSQGSQKFNEKLSQDRAEAVRQFLLSRGVAADRVRAQGLGPSRPIADNKSPEGRANNRRVEIVVQPSGGGSRPAAPTTPSTTQPPSGA
jgi:outer membrane protein OmpA-like peptidoglycan-associated protein